MTKGAGKFEYEAQEPAFLRRMRGEVAGSGLDGRHERPVARPRRTKASDGDEDDGPTYVDEASNDTMTKSEYEAMVLQSEHEDKAAKEDPDTDAKKKQSKDDKDTAQIGQQSKKRKAVKIGTDDEEAVSPKHKSKQISKKPKKAIALSFGNEAEED